MSSLKRFKSAKSRVPHKRIHLGRETGVDGGGGEEEIEEEIEERRKGEIWRKEKYKEHVHFIRGGEFVHPF